MRITEQWFVCENANCKPLTFPGVRTDPRVHQAGRGVVKKYRMAEGQKPPTCFLCWERMTPTTAPEGTHEAHP